MKAGGGDRQAERGLAEEPASGPWPEPAGDARGASRAGRAMITRSLSRLHQGAKRRSLGRGRGTRASSLAAARPGARVRQWREQVERATAASNYWASSSYANNPANAWNVNFNDGNVNANNKSNNNFVRAVRGGS